MNGSLDPSTFTKYQQEIPIDIPGEYHLRERCLIGMFLGSSHTKPQAVFGCLLGGPSQLVSS